MAGKVVYYYINRKERVKRGDCPIDKMLLMHNAQAKSDSKNTENVITKMLNCLPHEDIKSRHFQYTEWPKKMYTLFTHQYLWNKFK
jgi:hypothetical protein